MASLQVWRVRSWPRKAGRCGAHRFSHRAVHEAYLRLIGQADIEVDSRGHSFVAAGRRPCAESSWNELVSRGRIKRASDRPRREFHDDAMSVEPPPMSCWLLTRRSRPEAQDERKARVVMLRHFAGLSVEETAGALNASPATVKNDWAFAEGLAAS